MKRVTERNEHTYTHLLQPIEKEEMRERERRKREEGGGGGGGGG